MVTRCSECGRGFIETDAGACAPVCARCAVDACDADADARGEWRAIADALRAVAPVPVSWFKTLRGNE